MKKTRKNNRNKKNTKSIVQVYYKQDLSENLWEEKIEKR